VRHTRSQLEERLRLIIRGTAWLMEALEAVRDLQLPAWCIGAGAIRNVVWDSLQNVKKTSALSDLDVAYFDPADMSPERDHALQRQLALRLPALPWEVTNQAGVHIWFESVFGHKVEPLCSLEEAVSTWPETATAVGVALDRRGKLQVIAPIGLDDLFAMIVRRNPARVSVETYQKRIVEKRYTDRWPSVRVIPAYQPLKGGCKGGDF
jgi:hypothetical protein